MLTKPLLLALLAACGAPSNVQPDAAPPDAPDDVEPPDVVKPPEAQYFCCQSVSADTKTNYGHGDGCNMIDAGRAALCSELLYCPSGFVSSQGSVDCPL